MSSLKKTAVIITALTLCSKFIGFGREIALAYFFGTSYVVDAYLMAISIPTILFGWLGTVAITYTPVYTDIRQNQGMRESSRFNHHIVTLTACVSLACIVIASIFTDLIVSLTAPGFDGEVYLLTVRYLRVSICALFISSIMQILINFLYCNNRFVYVTVAGMLNSAVLVVSVVISGIFDSNLLIYGYIVANIVYFVMVCFLARKASFNYKFELKITPEIKRTIVLLIPIFISNSIWQINSFVDKMFASQLAEGSIAALNYAVLLRTFIYSMFIVVITTLIYPILSDAAAKKDIDKVKSIYSKGLNFVVIMMVPITIGAILLAKPAIGFVYQRGEFTDQSTIMTYTSFIMYAIGLISISIGDISTKVFYSMQDTKSIMKIGIVTVVFNIILNVLLVKPLAHNGLALATSLSSIITLPLFFLVLRRKLGSLGLMNSLILSGKASVAGLIMGVFVFYGYRLISVALGTGKLSVLLSIGITAATGGAIYFALMILMRVKEMDFFTGIAMDVVKKLKRR